MKTVMEQGCGCANMQTRCYEYINVVFSFMRMLRCEIT